MKIPFPLSLRFAISNFDNVREKICNAFVLGWECFQYGQILWDLSRWLNDLGAQGTQAGNLLNHCFAPMQDHLYIYKCTSIEIGEGSYSRREKGVN